MLPVLTISPVNMKVNYFNGPTVIITCVDMCNEILVLSVFLLPIGATFLKRIG